MTWMDLYLVAALVVTLYAAAEAVFGLKRLYKRRAATGIAPVVGGAVVLAGIVAVVLASAGLLIAG